MTVAIFGGSGKLGLGLARRAARAGHNVLIGSRDPERARAAAAAAGSALPPEVRVEGLGNIEAAARCDMAVIAVPYGGRRALLDSVRDALQGKIVIDATVPIDPTNPSRLQTESGRSAAEESKEILGPGVGVYAAFQTIAYKAMRGDAQDIDVLVAGPETRRKQVFDFISALGFHPVAAGELSATRFLEMMTLLLISINTQYKIRDAGFRILGLPPG